MENTPFFLAFWAGLLSFFSPCVLPLAPVYLSYLSGVSLGSAERKIFVFLHGLCFVLGFSLVFVSLGGLAGLFSTALVSKLPLLQKIAGVFLMVLGLHLIGLRIPLFFREKRLLNFQSKKVGYLTSFLVGISFSLGWTACVGPILGGILILALNLQTALKGVYLLSAYSLGLGTPFLISSLALNFLSSRLKKLNRHLRVVEIISGLFLIGMGVWIFSGFPITF